MVISKIEYEFFICIFYYFRLKNYYFMVEEMKRNTQKTLNKNEKK